MHGVQLTYFNVYRLKGVLSVIDLHVYMRVKLASVSGKERWGAWLELEFFFNKRKLACVSLRV